jgi:hypothetical protein
VSDQLVRAHRILGNRLKFHVVDNGAAVCGTAIEGNWAVADRAEVERHCTEKICKRCVAREEKT